MTERRPGRRRAWTAALALLCLGASSAAQTPRPGKNVLLVRGHPQDLYCYPAAAGPAKGRVLFAPGDGGWRGFAVTIAQTLAGWGYDVCGLDTKRYLESFTGRTTLSESEVMGDFAQIGRWMTGERVTVAGWSEGAGLALLAAAGPDGAKRFNGLVTVGLPEAAILGWRLADTITYLTKEDPNEPRFSTTPYLSRVAPLPLMMIQSSQDEYTKLETVRRLFAAAREPKRLSVINARNHRFDGNREDFFRALRDGIEWINQTAH